ncbi:hypothetical protein BLS_007571 [Venturia inaequalis]|uniref:Uncharacterized protein n=1 Tax=Venturia inaequalis TaxID=5025 RepID=A0A8H3Z9P5_VENIN|nr:hypothetical protein BLS_007571 [Venturia inaequalis]
MADFERKDVPMHDGEGVDNVAGLQFDSFLKLTDQCQPPPELGSIPEKAPRLLLSAALSHYLYNNVIFRPFYFLDYRGGGKSNGAQASKWRAELLRQLYPQDQTDSEYGEQGRAMLEMTKKATERAIQLSLSASLDNFLQMAKPLMSTSTAVNIETLQRMFSDASNISIAIWTQLRRFQLVDFSFLPQSFGDALQIMPETPLIEAHAMHTAVLEDDERSEPNMPIEAMYVN